MQKAISALIVYLPSLQPPFFFFLYFSSFFFPPSLILSKHLGIFSPSLYKRSPSSISLKETMGFIYIWVGYQRVGRLPATRWCANGFGAGPVGGDKSPQTSSWASNLVVGHFVEINVSVLQALCSLLPPNTLNSLIPKVCWGFVPLSQMEPQHSLQLLDYYFCAYEGHFYIMLNVVSLISHYGKWLSFPEKKKKSWKF